MAFTKEDIVEAFKKGASFGFEHGFSEATDCIRGLIEGANNQEAVEYASIMAGGLEQFAGQAHAAFMDTTQFKIILDSDFPSTTQ